MNRHFLDNWVNETTGPVQTAPVESLGAWHLDALNRTIIHARDCSRYYSKTFSGIAGIPLKNLEDMAALPFTSPSDIRKNPKAFLAVSQDEISRIVTLGTSGTTAAPKRLFFTDEDLDRTVDFFTAILSILMTPGDTGIIFLPGNTRASAGDLIRAAMESAGAQARVPGIIRDFRPAADQVRKEAPTLIIGMPVQILALGEYLKATGSIPKLSHVILTADYVPTALVDRVQALFGATVLNHYGMTETGFGGAIQCPAQDGLHLRHPDLFFEIINPTTGTTLPYGRWGELVVTTLNRQGMPLIRYRTGDVSRILTAPCACGSPFPRLDRIKNRQAADRPVTDSHSCGLTMADLDDFIFALPGVVDFSARVNTGAGHDIPVLDIKLMGIDSLSDNIYIDLDRSSGLKTAIKIGRLRMGKVTTQQFDFTNTYINKRQIQYI